MKCSIDGPYDPNFAVSEGSEVIVRLDAIVGNDEIQTALVK